MPLDLAQELASAVDPVTFADGLGITPDAWQCDVLRGRSRRVLLNCSRQAGKSTLAAVLALHTAIFEAGSLTLLLSPSLRQSSELFAIIRRLWRKLGGAPDLSRDNLLSLETAAGSRIVSLPGEEQNIRGYSGVSLIVVDEAARVPDELYFSVRPMLAVSGGRLILSSTPFGRRGFFYREWTEGGAIWNRVAVPADQCRRISAEFLAEERLALGDYWFSQEYLCEFRDPVDTVFSSELVRAALSAEVKPLFADENSELARFLSGAPLFVPGGVQ